LDPLCYALALWNGRGPILKERLFWLSASQICQSVRWPKTSRLGGARATGILGFQQDRELDRKKSEAILHQIQRLAYEKVMFAPIFELAFLVGVGPRVEEPALGLIDHFPTPAPWEDVRLKRQ
jgi:hypothetical protein